MTFRHFHLLIAGLGAVTLTGCGVFPTQWMPNGYRYNDNTPLSTPQPTRPWRDSAAENNLEHLDAEKAVWEPAVMELVDGLAPTVPPESHPVTLRPEGSTDAVNVSMDHYLRQALQMRGYTVNPTPDNKGVVLLYSAKPSKAHKVGDRKIEPAKGSYDLMVAVLGPKDKPVASKTVAVILPEKE